MKATLSQVPTSGNSVGAWCLCSKYSSGLILDPSHANHLTFAELG